MRYVFGDLVLDPERLELRSRGELVPLEPQAFDVLVYLVGHRDRVVLKEELMDQVWGGRFISEAAVTSRIKQVRRALGDDGQSQALIRTYHGRGYRFVADLHEAPSPPPAADGPMTPAIPPVVDGSVPVLTARREGRPVRYQLAGQGPPDLVMLPPSPSLEQEWADPRRAGLLVGLGAMCRLIRIESVPNPAGSVAGDLLEVLDDAACERAVVFTEGAPADPVLRFAVDHPGRVAALAFFGCHEGPLGTDTDSDLTAPTTAELPPIVVLHRSGDPVVDVAHGRRLAARLPGAEFRALPGDSHEAAADAGQVADALRDLVQEVATQEAARRSLTSLVGLCGDDLASLTAVLVGLGGRERRGPERSVIVSFDGPANAFRALGSRRARGLVDEVGVGVAIDDVSRDSLLISGHGVDVARLFAGLAAPGEVLFPNVIKHLLAGSGLSSDPLPPVDLPHVGPHPVHRWRRPDGSAGQQHQVNQQH